MGQQEGADKIAYSRGGAHILFVQHFGSPWRKICVTINGRCGHTHTRAHPFLTLGSFNLLSHGTNISGYV